MKVLKRGRSLAAIALSVFLISPAVWGIQPIEPGQARTKLSQPFIAPELAVQADMEPTTQLALGQPTGKRGAAQFLQREGGSWEMRWDRRTDRPNLVQGSGIALVPGKGNHLSTVGLGLAAGESIELATVESRLRAFIADNADFLQTQGLDFRLDPDSSTPYGEGRTHWFVEFAQYANGVRVDRAQLFFRISHGNIVQFGEDLVAPVLINTQPSIGRADAFTAAWAELAFPTGTEIVETREAGELLVLPVLPHGDVPGESWSGPNGAGIEHRLAWRFVFRINDDDATYEVLFDAHRGAIIEVRNLTLNVDAEVTGGIYPTTNTDPEIVVPMPFLAVSNGGAKITDALGMYDYSGGSATTSLDGKYFRMSDNCGAISLANSTDGNLNFGTSGGTDCTTPGVGGAGNTHASRTGFYHLTNINRKAATFHPANSWLASKVTANMNINDQCNASWNGTSMNFFKSGGGCSNTGELAAVFLHEWGHGMDTNTGGAASEYGSGEAVGDTFAFLETRDSCIGHNFKPGVPCYNCGSCSGVRDVKEFSTHGAATIAKPSTITASGGPACARFACPYLQQGVFPYQGPMGYEGHCESYIASSANWDLTQALVEKHGSEQGWHEMDRIWYGSLVPSKSAYQVVSGGKCNVNAVVNGCGSNNWYTVFLAADDDDGNLANGTPNACRIWDAFDAHGIACGARPVCSADAPDFSLTIPGPSQATCAPGSTTYTVNVGSQMGFTNPVTLTASGLPAGVSAAFSPNPITPAGSTTLTLTASSAAQAGTSTITVNGAATSSPGHAATVLLSVNVGQPAVPALSLPVDGATGTARQPVFTWAADVAAVSYTIDIASDAAFTNIIDTATPTAPTYTAQAALQPLTTYYWRVRANSPCGNSAMSVVYSFTTGVTFPEPYCTVTFPSAVEPITRVQFAGIDNPSGAAVNGSPALEDFTAIVGQVNAGNTLSMTVQGNTAGSFSNTITAYVDWNRNGVFTDPGETYTIGTIANSTGLDGKQATANIAVPATASNGPVRLRVTKKYNAAATSCNNSGYGQAEDYTLLVGDGATTYTVGGNVAGLAGSGLVLRLNGTTSLPVTSNGPFTFASGLAAGTAYSVTVEAQPSAPAQTCTVANGSGTMGAANVTSVAVNCTTTPPPVYTVGGNVNGLLGSGLVLSVNGGGDLPVTTDGPFTFVDGLVSGTPYSVTVTTQPMMPAQICTVSNGSGTMGAANVTDVAVTCVSKPPSSFTVGGTVSGLVGTGLKLRLNRGANLAIAADGAFAFTTPMYNGDDYLVSVVAQPANPTQTCSISNGSGTIGTEDVDDVTVTCVVDISDRIFANGFELGVP